jgi:hypothetical protein
MPKNKYDKKSSSLSPIPKRQLRSNSASSDLLSTLPDRRRRSRLNSGNDNDDSSLPGMFNLNSGGSSSSSSGSSDVFDDTEDENMDIEDPDGLDALDLDNFVEDTSYETIYPTALDGEYDFNAQNIRPNQYGVAYNTNNLGNQYDLRRFDDILKAKKNRSRYAEDPSSTYGSVATFRATNPDTAFMRAYDQQDWSDKYQIGRAKRKRSDEDMMKDKIHATNMLRFINSNPQSFNPSDLPVQNLIRALENRIRHPPQFENNYDWNSNSLFFNLIAAGRHHLVYNPKHSTYNSLIYDMRNKIGKKGNKYENYHVATGDFDNDPNTPDNVLLLNELN